MRYKCTLIYLLLGLIGLIGFLVLALIYGSEWFARGGAVITLCGLASEYSLLQAQNEELSLRHRGSGAMSGGVIDNYFLPKPFPLYKNWAHTTVMVGTMIWGFGDVLLTSLQLSHE